MPFHVAAFTVNAGVNDANVDMTAATDNIFTVRNSHLIFTEQYQLIGATHFAASATRARFNVPTWNAIARQQIHPVERSATIADDPGWLDLRNTPLMIPQNEEIAIEESNNLGAGNERTNTLIWLSTPGPFMRNLNLGVLNLIVRATATITVSANAWSAAVALTFAETLRGGWYAINGAQVIGASDLFFRFLFPRAPFVGQRQLRPGGLCTEAVANMPLMDQMGGFGVWGLFHSFEPPTIEVFALTAGATALEVRLWLGYLGERLAGV